MDEEQPHSNHDKDPPRDAKVKVDEAKQWRQLRKELKLQATSQVSTLSSGEQ